MSSDTRGPRQSRTENQGRTETTKERTVNNATDSTPRQGAQSPSADEIRVAYECHTLAQMLLERLAMTSTMTALRAAPPFPMPAPRLGPWSYSEIGSR